MIVSSLGDPVDLYHRPVGTRASCYEPRHCWWLHLDKEFTSVVLDTWYIDNVAHSNHEGKHAKGMTAMVKHVAIDKIGYWASVIHVRSMIRHATGCGL